MCESSAVPITRNQFYNRAMSAAWLLGTQASALAVRDG
jgi:hypothetical protein